MSGNLLKIIVILIIVIMAIIVLTYPRKNTFIDTFLLKGSLKGFELKISTKEKNGPSTKHNRSNHK